jgi:hypothetical protein
MCVPRFISNLILFKQNIVWGFLTKVGTKIDSYKMNVYGTSGISNLAVIFKMATKMSKNWPCPDFRENWYTGQTWCDEFIYDLKNNHRTAFSERSN